MEAIQVASLPRPQQGFRRRTVAGVVFYESGQLTAAGVRHAFSTRIGGVSSGPFDSLTLGSPANHREPTDRVRENWHRLLEAADLGKAVVEVHQVHGNNVIQVVPETGWQRDPLADALVSRDPVRPIAVRVADCCPILLASADGGVVAAVHAGWRGVIAGVIESAVGAMAVLSDEVIAAVGPCIGVEAFEVGPEVLATFRDKFGDNAPLRTDGPAGTGHVDLAASAALCLRSAGVRADHMDIARLCTVATPYEFFSHRRDAGLTGRMAAVIQARVIQTRSVR